MSEEGYLAKYPFRKSVLFSKVIYIYPNRVGAIAIVILSVKILLIWNEIITRPTISFMCRAMNMNPTFSLFVLLCIKS